MKNNKTIILFIAAIGLMLSACAPKTQWGVARLPDAREIFITTADEAVFVAKKELVIPYQPVGFLEIKSFQVAPCQSGMKHKYTSLEKAISKDLIDKARKELGGDAVIDFSWAATSTADTYLDMAASAGRASSFMMSLYPFALLGNQNIIEMKGTVVKKK